VLAHYNGKEAISSNFEMKLFLVILVRSPFFNIYVLFDSVSKITALQEIVRSTLQALEWFYLTCFRCLVADTAQHVTWLLEFRQRVFGNRRK